MWVARHVRQRLLILFVSILGFFVSTFSAVLALDFTGPVVSVLDGDTIKVLHNKSSERIRQNIGDPCGAERDQAVVFRSLTQEIVQAMEGLAGGPGV
jgi:endonuclease YncB( thermonuclease family)